jgi:hypothetical protein
MQGQIFGYEIYYIFVTKQIEKWIMDNKKTRYQQNYSLWNEISVMNSRLYQMW